MFCVKFSKLVLWALLEDPNWENMPRILNIHNDLCENKNLRNCMTSGSVGIMTAYTRPPNTHDIIYTIHMC